MDDRTPGRPSGAGDDAAAFLQRIQHTVSLVNTAITNVGLYSLSHPSVDQYLERAFAMLAAMTQERGEVTFLLIGQDIVVDNQPLSGSGAAAAYLDNFGKVLRRKSVERLTFLQGMTKADLVGIVGDLSAGASVPVRSRPGVRIGRVEIRVRSVDRDRQGAPATADAGTIAHAADARSDGSAVDAAGPAGELLQELKELTATELDELKELYHRIQKHRKIDVRGVEDIVRGFIKSFRQEINPLGILASLKTSHEYTFTHVANVGILTMSAAESMGFSGEHLHQIGVASLLHDVGKMFIPAEILGKTGALTQEERKIMETHTVRGARYLTNLEGIPKLAVLAALEHHIRYDGSGYPNIRGGWQPNIASQIIAVADVFDAMRSKRSYQEAHSLDKIEAVLAGGKGKAFSPLLVDHFLKMVKK
jgi:HD-GYP domain-containing protein (c-di-GMP phosphodiesterase class II)